MAESAVPPAQDRAPASAAGPVFLVAAGLAQEAGRLRPLPAAGTPGAFRHAIHLRSDPPASFAWTGRHPPPAATRSRRAGALLRGRGQDHDMPGLTRGRPPGFPALPERAA